MWREKLSLILHIRSLAVDSLARRIGEEQKMFGWPGLAKETSEICKTLHIEDVNETSMSKTEYRRLVTKMLHLENERRLRSDMEGKRKCQRTIWMCRCLLKDNYTDLSDDEQPVHFFSEVCTYEERKDRQR